MINERLEQLITIFDQGSKDPFIKYAIATEYLKGNNIPEALRFYEDLILNHPDYVGTYYHLGKLYNSLDRKEDAKSIFEKGILIAGQNKNFHALSELKQIYSSSILGIEDEYD